MGKALVNRMIKKKWGSCSCPLHTGGNQVGISSIEKFFPRTHAEWKVAHKYIIKALYLKPFRAIMYYSIKPINICSYTIALSDLAGNMAKC